MKSHADRELEPTDEIQDLSRRVLAPQDLGPLRVLHVSDHRMTVLNVSLLHWYEDDVRVISLADEVRRVGKQGIVVVGLDVGSGGTGLSDGEADQRPIELDALGFQRVWRQVLRLEQECRVGGEMNLPRN